MKKVSKKQQAKIKEWDRIKTKLFNESPRCFFSGRRFDDEKELVLFHIIGKGKDAKYELDENNLVLSEHKWNMDWEQPYSVKIKIPNVERAIVRMKSIDIYHFNRFMIKASENLSEEEFKTLNNKVCTYR